MSARHGSRSRFRLVAVRALATGALLASLVPSPSTPAAVALTLVPVPDTLSTRHDRVAVVPAPGVLGNDLNLLGAQAVLVSGASHGTVVLASNGGYTYTPNSGYTGIDVFRYRPTGLLTPSTTVTITVTNVAPVAVPDAYTGAEDTELVVPAPGVLANDIDADGDVLRAELVDGGGNGSLDVDFERRLPVRPGRVVHRHQDVHLPGLGRGCLVGANGGHDHDRAGDPAHPEAHAGADPRADARPNACTHPGPDTDPGRHPAAHPRTDACPDPHADADTNPDADG